MKRVDTHIEGLFVIEPAVFADERGWFYESHHADKFAALGVAGPVVQINNSWSKKGVLRGMHFQRPPFAQAKTVRCVAGAVFDVAVDLRRGSPTYGAWYGVELSAENKKMLHVPAGFAHGFLSLTDCEFQYLVGGGAYNKVAEGGLRWDGCGIEWPALDVPVHVHPRDAAFGTLAELSESPFVYERVAA